ncbi:MAG TPA: hypothetical protein VLI90_06670, partial [Tepidisphaeraceae bacterium]|nr:hypothetical protein [Tepidisphaeraceae bacterium]
MSTTRGQFKATVLANVPLCREHFRLVLRADGFPPTEPGQFVQVACRDLDRSMSDAVELDWQPGDRLSAEMDLELRAPLAVLRRPFSLAGRRDVGGGAVELDIIHRVVGVGTHWMSQLQSGDAVHLIGPLGNTFTLPGDGEIALLIGGGVGIPPMIYLAEALARRGNAAVAFAGALTRDLLPLMITGEPAGAEPRPIIDEVAR